MPSSDKGKLYIVGTGPGNLNQLTKRAVEAVQESDYVIGNDFYLKLIGDYLEGKEVIWSSMGKEVERARKCIELAKDHVVSMVSGGDPGVYGMAGIVLEVLEHDGADIDFEVIPGVTAATAAASRIGSPISGDYVTISLSDLLTPMEVIEKRLGLAFQMGVPVVLYNPKSRGRPDNLAIALSIALGFKSGKTPVGIVKNAFREEQDIRYYTLDELFEDDSFVDMHSIVIIGGEESRFMDIGDRRGIITPRGYERKYVY
ncbi:precorrin-3B C(17)-methyltransferase [Methanoplanus sp. FWC-SCC4]|uniref:Precorrin-3B C(17)-methyltransferase n=1 Tax=Methanochimaera problematica TaxID=2609417 RepID=A0AA97FE76_9EURY|nr:precorrin-3B C(17)-methyltransferase [Methanoplanus sp. FWC-SCC4]WOF15831.1 precorrin-3B C(17)-methyltransferase [Methanoplanus sp. FWC-SCC4]